MNKDRQRIEEYVARAPYEVIRCDSRAHIVRDTESGEKGFAIFEGLDEGDDEIIASATPSLIMYSLGDGMMTLSVSNPDLALYSGPSDEIFDGDGKRVERSIYGRKWVDAPCGATTVRLELNGEWEISDSCGSDVSAGYSDGRTVLTFATRQARTEEIILSQKH